LLKYTGKHGVIGLVLVMQCAMYAESTSVVETYYNRKTDVQEKEEVISFHLQKWWWFATAIMMTSGRYVSCEIVMTSRVVPLCNGSTNVACFFCSLVVYAENCFRNTPPLTWINGT